MDDLLLDPRLPALVEIEKPTRQRLRHVARKRIPCARCRQPLTTDDLCMAMGRDSHRHCAEFWNAAIFQAWEELKAQDAEQAVEAEADAIRENALDMGLALPKEDRLWTPPIATKPPKTPAAAVAGA